MSVKASAFLYNHGLIAPIAGIFFASLASFSKDTRPANIGADADVPPTAVASPCITTCYPSSSLL